MVRLNPQPGPNRIAIHRRNQLLSSRQAKFLERSCEFTPVMACHLGTGEVHQQRFSFTALMQGDFALQELTAQIGLERSCGAVIQRETLTRLDERTESHDQQTQPGQGTSI